MHGFFVDFQKKEIRFDLVMDFVPNRNDIYKEVLKEIQAQHPDFRIYANMDVSYSD